MENLENIPSEASQLCLELSLSFAGDIKYTFPFNDYFGLRDKVNNLLIYNTQAIKWQKPSLR